MKNQKVLTNRPYLIMNCPNGSDFALQDTDICVPGGAVRECRSCGQMVSSCDTLSEISHLPARLFNKGHQMEVFLRSSKQ